MIYKPDRILLKAGAVALLMGLSACSEPAPDIGPIDRARQALAVGDALQAEVVLRDQLAAGVAKVELAAFLGEAELQQGQLAEARQWLEKGEFSKDTKSHGFHMLARLEMAEGNLPAAGQAFDKALAIDDKNSDLWVDIARLRYRGGEQIEAVEASILAVELDEDNPRALQFRAQLVRDSEGMLASLPWFERALERNPEDTDLLYDYAATLGEIGQAKNMLVAIRQISKIDPANRKIYYLQAVLAARAGKFELARSLLLRSSKEMQELPAAMLLAGIIDIENGNYASAAQSLERLAAKQPDNRRVREMLARALSLGGNDKELIYLFADAAKLPSGSPYLKTLVGRSYEALDEREKAGTFLDMAAKARSNRLIAVQSDIPLDIVELRGTESGIQAVQRVRAQIVAGNLGKAEAAAKKFLDQFPGSADALSLAGDAALAGKNNGIAIARYQRAVAIRGPWSTVRKYIKSLQASGKNDEALVVLARYFTGDPANTEASAMLGGVAIENEDWAAASTFLDHAITNGGYRDPMLLSLRSNVALAQGDTQLAHSIAQMAYEILPLNIEATRALVLSNRAMKIDDQAAARLEAKLEAMQASN